MRIENPSVFLKTNKPTKKSNKNKTIATTKVGLRSKRFRGVWEHRKTEERDFRCFCRAKNGARAKKRKRGVPFFARATPTPRKRLLRRLTKVESYRKFYQQFYFRNGKPRRILMTITLENGSKLSRKSTPNWAPECNEWY